MNISSLSQALINNKRSQISSKVEGKSVLDPFAIESKSNDKRSGEEANIDGELNFQNTKVEEIIKL